MFFYIKLFVSLPFSLWRYIQNRTNNNLLLITFGINKFENELIKCKIVDNGDFKISIKQNSWIECLLMDNNIDFQEKNYILCLYNSKNKTYIEVIV